MMILIVSLAVALVAFIIYALDRKMKDEPISWETAGKLSLFGGLISAGVIFATGPEIVNNAVKTAVPSNVQDMFVGVPTF
jgi:hypothetical protein